MQTHLSNNRHERSFAIINKTPIDRLFQKYEEVGFLYPAKRKLLGPHFSAIKANWKNLVRSNEELLCVYTMQDQVSEHFASIAVIRNGPFSLMPQHLVSDGNPFLSLQVMLEAQKRTMLVPHLKHIMSSQNWFRPNNRYAFRVFASMYERLGKKKASLLKFQYLHMAVHQIDMSTNIKYACEEVVGLDAELMSFVKRQLGEVFVRGEELNQTDITFKRFGRQFERYGLPRSRKILKFRNKSNGKIEACVIANRAPIGLNFSFLENRAYYVLKKRLSNKGRGLAIQSINANLAAYYGDFSLGCIPIVTDIATSKVLQNKGATFLREYLQSIWMREGFREWYDHIDAFLKRIGTRG